MLKKKKKERNILLAEKFCLFPPPGFTFPPIIAAFPFIPTGNTWNHYFASGISRFVKFLGVYLFLLLISQNNHFGLCWSSQTTWEYLGVPVTAEFCFHTKVGADTVSGGCFPPFFAAMIKTNHFWESG